MNVNKDEFIKSIERLPSDLKFNIIEQIVPCLSKNKYTLIVMTGIYDTSLEEIIYE